MPLAAAVGGWIDLFNGKDLAGWQGLVDGFEVMDGVLRSKPGKRGVMYTAQEYGDFVAEVEFKLTPGANNGLAIRYPGSGDPAYDGMCEIQILDSEHPKHAKLDPRQHHGSAYALAAAKRGHLRPAGQWNQQQVTVRGSNVTVEFNGEVILDADLAAIRQFMGNKPHPGKDRKKGHFGFFAHDDIAEFRNIRIRPLDSPAASANIPADAQMFNGHAYKFFAEKMPWKTAKAKCEALDGHLIIVNNAEENAFAAKLVEAAQWEDAWIGATDEAKEGDWRTVQGGPLTYTNWYTGQPNNKQNSEHWALMSNRTFGTERLGWKWSDQPNDSTQHKAGYLCEWENLPVK
jgi:hypothetical protein